jgi:flagellar motor switch protein FliN/FliY
MSTVSAPEKEERSPQTTEEGTAAPEATTAAHPPGSVVTQLADFAELAPTAKTPEVSTLESLLDVKVTVTAELGRASLVIGDVLKLGPGSVLELDRGVSEPVELYVQGVRLARGEVVVVDDRFAIRIKELCEPRKKS